MSNEGIPKITFGEYDKSIEIVLLLTVQDAQSQEKL